MNPIEEQLQAYNTRDLKRFLSAYSPDVVIEDGEDNMLMKGHDQMRERYQALFDASPELHCRIVNRLKIGKYTVDEEEVTGWQGSPTPVRAIVIYRVDAEKILHVRMLVQACIPDQRIELLLFQLEF
ncbi:MAG: nuclear transport factor 2 family protein [Omnitrophica WOR_2 bacterium]